MKYFAIFGQNNWRNGVAYDTRKTRPLMYNVFPERGPVVRWKPLDLELRDGVLCSYPSFASGGRLCSPELRALFDEHAGPKDVLQWLPVSLREKRKRHEFWLLHFPKVGRIVDREHSMYSGAARRKLIWPVFKAAALEGRAVFDYKDQSISSSIFISEDVKQAIKRAKLTGMEYTAMRTV